MINTRHRGDGMKLNIVKNIDCLEGVRNVKSKSVDLVFCDLPFGETQNSWDKIIAFDKLWSAINRVKKDNAAVCLFAKGKFVGRLMCSNLNSYRYKVVCKKRQPKGHLNAKNMKKLICLLGHNKMLMERNECEKEQFENDNRAITVYKCKYCGADIAAFTRYMKSHFRNPKDSK